MESFLKKKLPDLILFVFIIIIGLKQAINSERVTDIIFFDETQYLTNGIKLNLSSPFFRDGFVYSIWYKILSFFTSDNIALYFLNNNILLILPGTLLYILLRVLKVNILISFIATVVFLISSVNILVWPFITKFAICFMLTGLILAYKADSTGMKLLISVYTFAILLYIRPEYFISFILISLIYLFYAYRKFFNKDKITFLKRLSPFIPVVLIVIIFNPLSDRVLITFAHNYIIDLNERSVEKINFYHPFPEIMKEHFGTDQSLAAAFVNKPDLFLEHFYYNILRFKNTIPHFFPHYLSNESDTSPGKLLFFSLMILLLLFSIYALIRRIKERRFGLFSLITFLYVLPVIISSIFFYPQRHYLIIFDLILLIFVCYELSRQIQYRAVIRKMSFPFALAIGILLMIFIPARSGFPSIHESKCTTFSLLNSMKELNIQQPVNMIGAAIGVQTYLGTNFRYIGATRMKEPFSEFSKKNNINAVLINSELLSQENIKNDPDFMKIFADTNYVKINNSDCPSYLLIRKEILK